MKEKLLQYNATDFATDESFIDWVVSGHKIGHTFWSKWIAEHPDKSSVLEEAEQIISSLKFKETTKSIDTQKLWSRIEQDTTKKASQNNTRIRYIASLAAAASVIFILYFSLSGNGAISHTTDYGEQLAISLPDQSSTTLNSGSALKYDKDAWEQERSLFLEGEAFFEVRKGEKFTVNTAKGSIEVLGTSFNVFQRDNDLEVICLTGKVKVSNTEKNSEVILLPGQSCYLGDDNTIKMPEQSALVNEVDWLDGQYDFDNAPLQEVFKSLERQFNVEVNSEDLDLPGYTGSFSTTNLDSAIYSITWPMNLEYRIEGKQIIIEKR